MPEKKQPTTLTFKYETSDDFATRYADGATANVTPGGNIYLGFFLERPHDFDSVVYEISPEGNLGKEISRSVKDGVCRQIQSAVVMNPAAARAISKLLLDTLDKMDASKITPVVSKKGDSHGS